MQIGELIGLAARRAEVLPDAIVGSGKDRNIANARFGFMLVARNLGYNQRQIAEALQRDQSTISYGLERGHALYSRRADFRSYVDMLRFDAMQTINRPKSFDRRSLKRRMAQRADPTPFIKIELREPASIGEIKMKQLMIESCSALLAALSAAK